MRRGRVALRAAGVALLLAQPLPIAFGPRLNAAMRLPSLVFVSRAPAADRAQVPGLGPGGRTLATGGVLMVRSPDGSVRPLLRPGELFDVSDPCVSWDGTRIAFAGMPDRGDPWRIYAIGADGRGFRAITRSDRTVDLSPLGSDSARFGHYDDFDPCWLPDGRVCFASTRFPETAQRDGVPSSNLFVVGAEGGTPERI